MGDRGDAAEALVHMPRWVAVHECTLAKLDVIVAMAGASEVVDSLLADLDQARRDRDRALGTRLDEPGGQS